mgnify:CR=1 FL=1
MIAAKKVPTSKLVYASVFPGKIEVKSNIGVEEEVFLRLTKEFKLTPNQVHSFVDRERDIIISRGEDLSSYYFSGTHTVEECLRTFYSSFDYISKIVSYGNNLNNWTFSELVMFFNILGSKYSFYSYRQLQLEKKMKAEDKKVSKLLNSHALSAEKEEAYKRMTELKQSLSEQKALEHELVGLFQMLRNCDLSKIASYFGIHRDDVKFVFRLLAEGNRVSNKDNLDINYTEEKANHKNLDVDVYSRDVDILSDFDVRGYNLQKRK